MTYQRVILSVGLCAVVALAGCKSAPRKNPLPTTPVEAGPGTTAGARKALEGRWEMVSLRVNAADGRSAAIEATGTLTADAYSNMDVEVRMSDAGQKALQGLGIKTPNPVISTKGRVVIDAQQRRITYVGDDFEKRALGFDPDLAARRANPFALERVRHYELGADGLLRLSTRYDDGKDAFVSQWKKAS
jgi:hypothetical protein